MLGERSFCICSPGPRTGVPPANPASPQVPPTPFRPRHIGTCTASPDPKRRNNVPRNSASAQRAAESVQDFQFPSTPLSPYRTVVLYAYCTHFHRIPPPLNNLRAVLQKQGGGGRFFYMRILKRYMNCGPLAAPSGAPILPQRTAGIARDARATP